MPILAPRRATTTAAIAFGLLALSPVDRTTVAQEPLAADRPIEFFVGIGEPRHGYRASDRELAQWALEAWAEQAAGVFTARAVPEREAVVRVYWPAPGDQLFGEMRPLVVNGRRGAAVYITTDMLALGPDLAVRARQDPLWRDAIVYLTCVHELGHALGLPHTSDFRDIMYSFAHGGDIVEYFARYRRQLKTRADLRPVSPFSAADVQQLRTIYRSRSPVHDSRPDPYPSPLSPLTIHDLTPTPPP